MTHKIDNKIRFLVIYQDITKNVNSIVQYTGIPERTVRGWVTKTENEQDILTIKSRRSRKQTIEEEKEEDIENQVREDPYKASLRRLDQPVMSHIEQSAKYCITRILNIRGQKRVQNY